jgi:hypothetical protein
MQIDLTIRATYLGPLKPETQYVAEEFKTADTIPLGAGLTMYQFTNENIIAEASKEGSYAGKSVENISNSGANARTAALQYAISHCRNAPKNSNASGVTKYDNGSRRTAKMVNGIFEYVDCSSIVVQSYQLIGAGSGMGWGAYGSGVTSSHGIMDSVDRGTFKGKVMKWTEAINTNKVEPGDILIRRGHMGFFMSRVGNTYQLFDAASHSSDPQVGQRSRGVQGQNWTHVLRPEPSGWVSQVANTGRNPPL